MELARFVWPLPFAGSFSPGRPVANADDTLVIFADGSWESGRESRLHILDTSDLSSIREISTVDFDEGPRRLVLGSRSGHQGRPGLLNLAGRGPSSHRRLGPREPFGGWRVLEPKPRNTMALGRGYVRRLRRRRSCLGARALHREITRHPVDKDSKDTDRHGLPPAPLRLPSAKEQVIAGAVIAGVIALPWTAPRVTLYRCRF